MLKFTNFGKSILVAKLGTGVGRVSHHISEKEYANDFFFSVSRDGELFNYLFVF